MNRQFRRFLLAGTVAAVCAMGLFTSDESLRGRGSSLISEAQARIGRPLTPMSYAGVARRTMRRCAVGVYYC
jgi:hypothetical protein